MDLDLSALDELVKTADGALTAEYVLRDLQRIGPMLKSADAATVQAGVNELQSWANNQGGLRKQFATALLGRMRNALGGMKARDAVALYGRKMVPGEAHKPSAALHSRFAGRTHSQPSLSASAPAPRVQQGAPTGRMVANARPAPKIQHGLVPHKRLSAPPPPAGAVADKAHGMGAKLAGVAAHHGFKLGLAAAAAGGAAAAAHKGKHVNHVAKAAGGEAESALAKGAKARWAKKVAA